MRNARGGSQAGLSLIELLIASFVGLLALVGVLYLFKAQSKGVSIQGSMAEMRMNGQFALGEVMYYLAPAGLGLPDEMNAIDTSGFDLLVNTNPSKRSAPATKDGAFATANQVKYNLNACGDTIFKKTVYAVVQDNNSAWTIVNLVSFTYSKTNCPTGTPNTVVFVGNKANFPATNTIYPLERTRIHRSTGAGADTLEGYFRVDKKNPFTITPALNLDSLVLAEGIDSLGYRYHMADGTAKNTFPANLDSLQRIEIIVRARTLVKDRKLPGDGYHRQTLRAKVNYRRSF